jgi:putative hydrolase of the HAD superfamily
MSQIKGVFFDLYGTLILYSDIERAWNDWLKTLHGKLTEAGLDLPISRFAAVCDGFFTKDVPQTGNDGLTVFERRIDRLCRELEVSPDREHLRSTAEASLGAWQVYIRPDPLAFSILRDLRKRYILALITNFDHPPHLHKYLPEIEIYDSFGAIVISGEVGVRKPSPVIFEVALQRTGLEAGQVAYIGDSYKDDVVGAMAAGLKPILISRPGSPSSNDFTVSLDRDMAGTESEYSQARGFKTIVGLEQLPDILEET